MNSKNRTVIFCENKVKRAKRFSHKLKPPSYTRTINNMQFSYIDSSPLPTIPPPPYESYEEYCKRTGKTPSSNPFDGYASNNNDNNNSKFDWSSDVKN